MALVLGMGGLARPQHDVAPEHFDNPAQSRLTARAHRPGKGQGRKAGERLGIEIQPGN
jgi:hypothetical protein